MGTNFLPAKARVLDLTKREGEELFTIMLRHEKPEVFRIGGRKDIYEKVYGSTYFSDEIPVCYAAAVPLENKVVMLAKEGGGALDLGYGFVEEENRSRGDEVIWAFVDSAYKLLPAVDGNVSKEIENEYSKKILWSSAVLLFFDSGMAQARGIANGQKFIIKESVLWKSSF
ncbi:MAG: hypothetical protein ACP5SJ_03155 [Candidatus Micrarchaeia archaeon]